MTSRRTVAVGDRTTSVDPASGSTPADVAARLDRLERHQSLFQADVHEQIARVDAIVEDLVTSVEKLRRRVETLERAAPPGAP